MPVTNTNGNIAVENVDYNLHQPFNPINRNAWVDDVEAQAWEDQQIAFAMTKQTERDTAERAIIDANVLAEKMNGIVLEIVASSKAEQVGTVINFTVTAKWPDNTTMDTLNSTFSVPIVDDKDNVVLIKGVTFTNGVAVTSITLTTSGYYYIKSEFINRDITGMRLNPIGDTRITVYE